MATPTALCTDPVNSVDTKASRASRVYEQLRWDIVHGVLRPNEPLFEAELAERLDVSRTPVRESLQRLAADGLIVLRRRRWHVYEHTADEVREIYEVRACQEGYAARLACERATDEQLAEIATARDLATAITEPAQRVANNDTFHTLINRAAGNTRLADLIERSQLYHFNQRLATLYTTDDLAASSQQHLDLIEAVTARNGDRAERIVRAHVQSALAMVERLLY